MGEASVGLDTWQRKVTSALGQFAGNEGSLYSGPLSPAAGRSHNTGTTTTTT